MNRRSVLASFVLTALLAGCSAVDSSGEREAPEEDSNDPPASAWIDVAATAFQPNGESDLIKIPAQETSVAVAVRATTAPGVCFQLSSAEDGEGRSGIDHRNAGSYCPDCVLRTSVAVEAGVFVLPVEPGRFQPETGLSLRFARMNCLTLTPLETPEDQPTIKVALQPVQNVPEQAELALRFHIAKDSILSGDDARQRALLDALEEELAPGGISPRLVGVVELDTLSEDMHFQAGDIAPLATWISTSHHGEKARLDVYIGGCLFLDNPIIGPPSAVKGFTPRIPGGAGPADGVFLPGLNCFAKNSGPDDIPVHAQARVLAHEIGHYLGLFHAVETDGHVDQLDDTSPENIMNPNPTLATSLGFSLSQGRVMRIHAALKD